MARNEDYDDELDNLISRLEEAYPHLSEDRLEELAEQIMDGDVRESDVLPEYDTDDYDDRDFDIRTLDDLADMYNRYGDEYDFDEYDVDGSADYGEEE